MTIIDSGPARAGLMARAQGIITKPAAEWDVIDGESATVSGLFTGYVCILAAIPLVAGILGALLMSVFFHGAIIIALVVAIVAYALELVGVFVVGFIVDALAPSFDGQRSLVQGMKIAAYSFTAVWVAGILSFIPFLGALVVIAAIIYGLYTMYLGLPKLMKNPPEKTMGYFLVVLVISIVIRAVMFWVAAAIGAMMMFSAAASTAAALGAFPH